jgi:hypothetical protein
MPEKLNANQEKSNETGNKKANNSNEGRLS